MMCPPLVISSHISIAGSEVMGARNGTMKVMWRDSLKALTRKTSKRSYETPFEGILSGTLQVENITLVEDSGVAMAQIDRFIKVYGHGNHSHDNRHHNGFAIRKRTSNLMLSYNPLF
ncbi:hypothetical protein V3C99_007555 [Haemonchus contortus]